MQSLSIITDTRTLSASVSYYHSLTQAAEPLKA